MRTFHHIELIQKILETPFEIIGQRDYHLYKSYSFPFNWFTKLEYSNNVKESIENMPSIEEYVTTQIGEDNLRTVLFDYYMGWQAEDQRHLFELCLNKIKEYESAFPIQSCDYNFVLKDSSLNLDIRSTLKHMILRPSMYGFYNFGCLRAYIDGYYNFKETYNLELSEYEVKLNNLIKFWKGKINPNNSFDTWDRPFRIEKMGTTDFTNTTNWEFERFEEILSEELKLKLINPTIVT